MRSPESLSSPENGCGVDRVIRRPEYSHESVGTLRNEAAPARSEADYTYLPSHLLELGLLFTETVLLLNLTHQLVTLTLDLIEIIVGKFARLFFDSRFIWFQLLLI